MNAWKDHVEVFIVVLIQQNLCSKDNEYTIATESTRYGKSGYFCRGGKW